MADGGQQRHVLVDGGAFQREGGEKESRQAKKSHSINVSLCNLKCVVRPVANCSVFAGVEDACSEIGFQSLQKMSTIKTVKVTNKTLGKFALQLLNMLMISFSFIFFCLSILIRLDSIQNREPLIVIPLCIPQFQMKRHS